MQLCSIEFETDKFPPILPESCQVNTDLYGFELAVFMSKSLAEKGVITSYPYPEDWGWFIEYITAYEQELMIGCASVGVTMGYPTSWVLFVRQRRKPRKGGPDAGPVLVETILSVLSGEGIEARHLPA